MPATTQSIARTRGIARVAGPFLAVTPAIILTRTADLPGIVLAFFGDPALVFIIAAIMLIAGLAIIAHHQYWSSAAAIAISLLGWYLTLRALALMLAPRLYEDATVSGLTMTPAIWAGAGLMAVIGLWLTYVGWIARPQSVA